MDSTTDPNPPPPSDPGVGHFHGEFWGGMSALYGTGQPNDQPFGIGWDHPVFRPSPHSPSPQTNQSIYAIPQQTQPQQQQQQQQPQPHQQPPPQQHQQQQQQPQPQQQPQQLQSWQQTPIQQQPLALDSQQQFSMSSPYRVSPYHTQQTPTFDATQAASSYHTYTYDPQTFYTTQQQVQQHNAYDQHSANVPTQRVAQPSPVAANTLDRQQQSSYLVPRPVGPAPAIYSNGKYFTAFYFQLPVTLTPFPGLQAILPKPSTTAKPRKKKGVDQKGQTLLTKFISKPAVQQPVNQTQSESSSDYSSDESDDGLEIEEPPAEPSPLPEVQPDDVEDLVKGVRDTWKARSEALKAAENQNLEGKIPSLKKEVILQRRLLDLIINNTLEFGHPSYVRRSLSQWIAFLWGTTIKELAQSIMDNAAAATKKKAEAAKSSAKDGGSSGSSTSQSGKLREGTNNSSQSVIGSKRAREDDSSATLTKRVVSPSFAKGTTRAVPGAAAAAVKKFPAAGKDAKSTTNGASQASAKPKANIVIPKPTPSLFSSLMSASKKPGTSNAARAAAAAAAKDKPTSVASETKTTTQPAAPPVAKPAFSFSETMANLNKPRERSPSKLEEDTPPETDEERKKRLRKEERRKLRVTWKPDSSLTEVRLFTHDPEEEIGYDDSMMRDVGDVAGEGRTLKLHHGLDDLDDEDEGWNEESLAPYTALSTIDFSDLLEEDRERNFTKTGGSKDADSPEKVAQDQREATTLSVFYTSPSEVPNTPKEPPPPDNDDEPYSPLVPFGEPDHFVKARSQRYFDSRSPPVQAAPQATPGTQPTNPAPVEISSLLKILQQNQQPQPVQQQSTLPPNVPDLQQTLAQFTANTQVPQLQQTSQPGQVPGAQGLDFQKLLAVMNAQKQMQQVTAFPQVATPQAPNLAALLSQLSNPAGQLQQQQQQQPQNQGQNTDSQSYNQTFYEDGDNKRSYEGDDSYDYNKRAKIKKHRYQLTGEQPKAGLVPCRYWKEGKCIKGDECTFRHDPLD
ncbi:C-x8-C-x5-C-x3-H type zinc finger protein [Nannizzia gypsea CBS 118893]|uniref:C-x8-C-x5-C-x3-H type zinc finger protein n=1 Tax=Arthroderma gypseum (strain ATCC MYA-4604 / CBS 118893) TaxID=535722 RepID=E4UNA6_ARTGP|nr:C-x8-C-x5-C-x3-H type zinc finger protein [Nannizzia gypsea CBS 118893]EFQ99567.1 C-x8-C-x5-C-x3-H type zinc finger protein [Nannizzia gypsea CBS 118893]